MKQLIKLASLLTLATPFLFSCNKTNDQTILDEANKYLTEAKDDIHTCHDAVVLLGNKFKTSYTLSAGSEFVFDISSKQMVIVKNNQIVKTSKGYAKSDNVYDYFKFVDIYNPNMQCSQYLKKSGVEMETIYITTGFDCGYHKDIKNVVYQNYSNEARKISINSYFDYLTINAPKDEVNVYNETNNLIVNKVGTLNMYGSTSYMKAKNGNINFCGDINNQSTRMFEVVEGCESNVKVKAINNGNVYSTINCDTIEGATGFISLRTINVATTNDILNQLNPAPGDEKDYLKLTADVTFNENRDATSICFNRAVCIDLNGHKLTIEKNKNESLFDSDASSYEGLKVESLSTEDRSLYIIDSQDHLDLSSGINLINCSIIVKAPSANENNINSNIVLNSGVVTQTVDTDDAETLKKIGPAIVTLGTTQSGTERSIARAQINGGKIICENETGSLDHCGCLGALGKGAILDIEYGDIESNDFCIFGNGSTIGYGEANLIISGGKVNSTENTCIYFPLKCDMTFSDCTIKGMSCLNVNSGTINMNGAKLFASGQPWPYSTKNYEGSVIYAPKDIDGGDLKVTATSCTMTSSHNYIVDVTGNNITHETTLNFNSGTYTYFQGDGISCSHASATITRNGTWTSTSI